MYIFSEFSTKKSEIKADTENEIGKFERKKRQVERLVQTEQLKLATMEDAQNKLWEQR